MALTNDAKIKDIITELQNMQMINGKAEITNVLGSPFTATDNPTQIVDKIQVLKTNMASNLTSLGQSSLGTEALSSLIGKVGNIILGKKIAEGRTYTNDYALYVSGLSFKPSRLIILHTKDTVSFFDSKRSSSYLYYLSGGSNCVSLTFTSNGFNCVINDSKFWSTYVEWIAIE